MLTVHHPPDQIHTEVRPWGRFEQFATNVRATVKVITIQPHQRLSLQRHELRDEMWHVIDGPVDVEVDGMVQRLQAGDRTWVPKRAMHRMGNSGDSPVRVLEVAFGHFDEDDIERFADDYARVPGSPT